MSEGTDRGRVLVIGAGIVGICTALALRREGFAVTVVDERGIAEGASKGNAGIMATAAVMPVGTPAKVRRVPQMLTDATAPLTVRWHYLPKLLPWLARFVMASRPSRVAEISRVLAAILGEAFAAYGPLLQDANAQHLIERKGWLYTYHGDQAIADAKADAMVRRALGVRLEELDAARLREFEPALGPHARFGLFAPDCGHAVDPHRLAKTLAEALTRAEGAFVEAAVNGFVFGPSGPIAAISTAGDIAFDQVVIAAGAWSRNLAAMLGSRVPLDTERGYHMTLPSAGVQLRGPLIIGDHYFGVTPLEVGVRIAGTVEFAGLDAPPNYERADLLLPLARRFLPGLRDTGASRWMGFRPSMPDSLPVIGRSPVHRNAWFAFGHGHLGLTLGAITAQLIAEQMTGRPPAIDIAPFRPDRF